MKSDRLETTEKAAKARSAEKAERDFVRVGGRGILTVAISISLSACGALTAGSPSPNAPPSDVQYATNPASYVYGTAITANKPTSARTITKFSISPTLPAGLIFDTTTGIITGTPTNITAATTYNVQATNPYGSAFIKVTLAITDYAPTITYGGATNLIYTVGTPISQISPVLGGGVATGCASTPPLPAGLILSNACVLTGTPAVAAAATTYAITANNSGGAAALPLQINVIDLPPVFSYASSNFLLVRGQPAPGGTATSTGGVIVSCTASPSLPPGLTISAGCTISGTPTTNAGSAIYSITANNSGGSASRSITLDVHDILPAFLFVSSPVSFVRGSAITAVSPTSTGGAIATCASSPTLPNGLALSAGCVISGTPSTASSPNLYTLTGTNAAGSSTATITIGVTEPPPTLRYLGSPFTYTHGNAISAVVPVVGGGAIASCSANPTLPTGLSISGTTCAITGTPAAAAALATYVVTAANSGGSATATISIKVNAIAPHISYSGSPYSFAKNVLIASATPVNTGDVATSCASNPALPNGLNLSSTCVISGTPTAVSTTATYVITATNAIGSGSTPVSITINDTPPSISYVGSPFTFARSTAIATLSPANTGGTILACASSPTLPTGLSISSTCVITGTPSTTLAAANYTVTATNSGGTSAAIINIKVNDIAPVISYTGSPLTYTNGTAIATLTPNNSGSTITSCLASPTLPPGLSLSTTCVISGVPAAVTAMTSYAITATNSGGSSTATISITVNDTLPILSYTGAPFAFVKDNAITSQTPTNSGGAVTSCSASPTLPAGLALSSTCVISGNPSVVAPVTTYSISATNSAGTASVAIDLRVNDINSAIAYAGSPFVWTMGTAISPLAPSNSGGAVVSCASSPTLPTGLALSSGCTISGTPGGVTTSAIYMITATNSGGTANTTIDITINDAVPVLSFGGSPFNFNRNNPIGAQTPTNTGGTPTICTSSPVLPTGLNLASNCVITGSASANSSSTSYTITGTNSGGSGATTIQITVIEPIPAISYSAAPYTLTKNVAIAAQTPTNTGGTISSCSAMPPLPTGLSLSTSCVITGTPSVVAAPTSSTITANNSSGSGAVVISFAVNDTAPAIDYLPTSYNFTFTKGTPITTLTPNTTGGAIATCSASPTLPAGLSLDATTCAMTGTPSVVQSSTSYTISATNPSGTSTAVITLAVNDALPILSYAASPYSLTKNTALATQTPTSSGGAITGCLSSPSLPSGLNLSSACLISGTPTTVSAVGSYSITATNSGGSATTSVSIAVNDVVPTISYAGSPFTYTIGVAISTLTPTLGGGAVTGCAASPTLPSGLSLSSNCVITGTPSSVVSSASYTITATNSGGSAGATISLQVDNGPPILSYLGSPLTFSRGSAMQVLNPINAGGAITSCASVPALPSGLVLSSGCVISGTPTVSSSAASYTITATNAQGTANAVISIQVSDSAPGISYVPGTVAYVLREAAPTTTPINTGGTTVSCGISPSLPTGLVISSTCAITGTPTTISASTAYSVTATNTGGSSSTTLNLQVKDQPLLVYSSTSALNGTTNGSAAASKNIWTATYDGVTHTTLTQNSNSSLDSTYPSWTTDGTAIVHASQRAQTGADNGTATAAVNVWTMTSTGASPLHVTGNSSASLTSDEPPLYSHDGSKIVFASKSAINGTDNGTSNASYNIFTADADGSNRTALTLNTSAGYDSHNPVFSPDGSFIYFSSPMSTANANGGVYASYNIWRMNADGSNKLMLTAETTGTTRDCLTPAISPNGTVVAYTSKSRIGFTTANSTNIWKVNYDGNSRINLTSNTTAGLDSKQPSFSRDSTEITFVSLMNVGGAATSSFNVWKMNANGASAVPLTTQTASGLDSEYPQFSPDNTRIAFASLMDVGASASSAYNIFVIKSDGTGAVTAVTANTTAGLDSHLSPLNAWHAP